jgi:hypothetical protein
MFAQTPQHPSEHAQQPIDPEFSPLACILADCQPEQLLAVAWRDDELVIIVAPGTKHVFTAKQVFDAGWSHGQLIRDQIRASKAEPAPVTPHQITALESVAAAHPGELAAAMINTPRPTPETHKPEPIAPKPEPFRDPAPAHVWPGDIQDRSRATPETKPAAFPAPAQPKPFKPGR